jgi:cell division protein ZapA
MADKVNLVHGEIFGQSCAVKAGADTGSVEALAALVDSQMKDVGRSSGAADTVRVAVLAALNLADELFRLRRELNDREFDPRLPRTARAVAPRASQPERHAGWQGEETRGGARTGREPPLPRDRPP